MQPDSGGDRIRLYPPRPATCAWTVCHRTFRRKTYAETAARYVTDGYLWNSGNFVFRAGFFAPENIATSSRKAPSCRGSGDRRSGCRFDFVTLETTAFGRATAKSIDYAVMERTERAAVMPVSYDSSDVGSWQAVWELSERDADGNAAQGRPVVDTRRSYVASEKQHVALLGIDDVIVVTTDDAVLVAHRKDPDGLRRVIKRLRQVAPALTQDHLKVHRPWGAYQSLDLGERYQVKRIVVKQGGRLSLQLHHHRAEHWVVVHEARE